VLNPGTLSRAYGLPPPVAGPALAWRLFGMRTALIGAAVLRGEPSARRAVLPIQLADEVVFAHAPLAMATSGVLVALCRSR